MTKNDQLHELVTSLSKNEKGYFKKYCKMYSSQQDQKYLKLFEAVDGVEDYSDKLIKQKLKGEIEERKLPVLKNYSKHGRSAFGRRRCYGVLNSASCLNILVVLPNLILEEFACTLGAQLAPVDMPVHNQFVSWTRSGLR